MGKIGCSIFLIPFVLTSLYIFPVQSSFIAPSKNVKLALLMSLLAFCVVCGIAYYRGFYGIPGLFFRPFMGIVIICGAGITAYLTSNVFIMIFRKYVPNEIDEDLERTGNRFE